MGKFFCLVIKSDLSIQRIWLDNNAVLGLLKEHKDMTIYRGSNDQIAHVIDDGIMWKDATVVEKVEELK